MIRNGKVIGHSNAGALWGSLIAWAVAYACLLGAIYAMGFWDFGNVWLPGLVALALAFVAMFIPKQLLGRGDTVDHVAIHAQHPTEIHTSHAAGTLHR